MSRSPYAPVQQRMRQREATRFESLAVFFFAIILMFTLLTATVVAASVEYGKEEQKNRELFAQAGVTDATGGPSSLAKPGMFYLEHNAEIKFVFWTLVILGAILLARKITKAWR